MKEGWRGIYRLHTKSNRYTQFAIQSHLGETEIPIGETDLLGFVAVAKTSETRWRRIDRIGGAEFDFWFWSYVDVGRYLRVLEHITKHFEQASH